MQKSYRNFCDKNLLALLEKIKEKNYSVKKHRFNTFDFETDNDEKEPQVYSWGVITEKYDFFYGLSISTFLDFLNNIKRNTIFYSQNGSKFDNYFLIPQLVKAGFKENYFWIDNIKDIQISIEEGSSNEDFILKNKKLILWLKKYLDFFINRILASEKELKGDIKNEIEILEKASEKDIFKLYKIVEKVVKENKFLKRRRLEKKNFN